MVAQNLHFVNHKPVLAGDLTENPLANTLNLASQNLITILRAKHHVKTHLPETMAHAKQIHFQTSEAVSQGAREAGALPR
jgi:hypothetical protein